MTGGAEYTFVPWVRDGYRPRDDGGTIRVELSVEGRGDGDSKTKDVGVDLSLYGPGEVTGIDRRQVIRTEPTPGTSDFPPNHFPIVEFDRPELPWLFSPEIKDDDGKLRPWMCLITVEQTDGVTLSTAPDDGGAVLAIDDPASPADHLPDPTESWAWTHAQVVGDDDTDGALEANRADTTLSRLLSPRDLDAETDYYACVVPTYEAGRLAGIGEDPFEHDDEGNRIDVTGDAWDLEEPPERIRLPVYYHWEFSTGKSGDFEALVRRLEPSVLEDVGVRQVDAGDPGPEALGPEALDHDGEVVTVEGAMQSFDISTDSYTYQDELVELVGQASALAPETAVADTDGTDRILGPPIYGQWPPAADEIPDEGDEPTWLRELNEDPRYRAPAAFGTDVVQDQQEQLMAEAWRQVGDIREANKLLRRARLARGASQQIHDRLDELDPAAVLSLTEPAHRRTIDEGMGQTVAATVKNSALPAAVLSPAFRRITRPNGPLSRRIGGIRRERIVEEVNDGTITLGDDGTPADGTQVIDADLAENVCSTALGRSGEDSDWEVLGEAGEGTLEAIVETLGSRCQVVRERTQAAMNAYEGPALDRLRTFLSHLESVCDEDRGGLLGSLASGVAAEDWSLVDVTLGKIARRLSEATDDHEALQTLSQSDPALAAVLEEDPGVTTAYEEFRAMFAVVRLRIVVEVLFEDACTTAREQLAALDVDHSEAKRAVAELEDLCTALCGDEKGTAGSVTQLRNSVALGAVEDIRAVVARMARILALAEARLAVVADHANGNGQPLSETCEQIEWYVTLVRRRLADAPTDPVADALAGSACPRPTPDASPKLDLERTAEAVREATDPAETIPERMAARLGGLEIRDRTDPLAQIMAHPEFDEPMYAPLRDLSQENLVPGVGDVPLDSVGVLETNPAFVEAYLLGLNHEMARELRWREYPTDLRGTYFRQFWDPAGRDPELTGEEKWDIEYVHRWADDYDLGDNYTEKMDAKGKAADGEETDGDGTDDAGDDEEGSSGRLVLLVRGALFDRYPNTHVYAAKGDSAEDEDHLTRTPLLPDPFDDDVEGTVEHPIFRGTLDPDVTFFGFDIDEDEALSDPEDEDDHGWFFVIEEPPSGPSFGLEVDEDRDEDAEWTWQNLTWNDVTAESYVSVVDETPSSDDSNDVPEELPESHDWAKNGAHMGSITWIRPFRAAIHADNMIPEDGEPT
ncbi:hypothetical protein [Natrarchaeobius chitinivorans]|uniref:Uncharacterized protein n=1 Tax=Natrarchaeobius chitinivorans TaxID=1679083 RepID=A0A3N6M1E8_NATCH|nr:hypothetical protein [Natrarchaeobius chitinivorans]RQG94174.1 hypothetical protein EA473_12415 [Natrarchaeobius chitinivorans]